MPMLVIFKAKAAAQGAISHWNDGTTRKKVGKKWIVVSRDTGIEPKSEERVEAEAWRKGNEFFNYSMATTLGGVVDDTLQSMGIDSYEALVEKIKTGPTDTAHKIYKQIVDNVRAKEETPGNKKAALDYIGRALIALRDQFASAPKTKLTIKVTTKTGKQYYKRPKDEAELPTLKPTAIAKAKKKMGGWSVTGPLTSGHVKAMMKTGAAKLVSGKVNPKKKWIMPKKAEDMELKYKGDSLLIRVKQIRKVKERTRATAKVEIKVPYEFAKAFLQNQIASKKTANNFIFRMERSAGYRDFLGRAAA